MTDPRSYRDFEVELRDLNQKEGTYTVAVLPAQSWGELPTATVHLRRIAID